ncbi:MAG: Flp family type IVb pilin [Alsobacter sp.]
MGSGRTGDALEQQTGLQVIRGLVRLFGANASGQSGVEYGVVAAMIGLAVAGSGGDLKAALQATLNSVSSTMDRAVIGPGAPPTVAHSVSAVAPPPVAAAPTPSP